MMDPAEKFEAVVLSSYNLRGGQDKGINQIFTLAT